MLHTLWQIDAGILLWIQDNVIYYQNRKYWIYLDFPYCRISMFSKDQKDRNFDGMFPGWGVCD